MEYFLVAFIGIVFAVIVIVKETVNIKGKSSLYLINIFGYMYGITYGLLPACILVAYTIAGIDLSHRYYIIDYSYSGLIQIFIWMIFGIFGYIVVQYSYKLFYMRRFYSVKRRLIIKKEKRVENFINANRINMFSKLQITMIICFIISASSLFLWTWAYGGIWKLILIADQVRDGVTTIENSIAFFSRPAKMILISFYMSLVLVKYRYNLAINTIFLIISFVLSLLMLIALDGRMGMAFFVITIFFIIQDIIKIDSFTWKKRKNIIIIGIIGMICILNMDTVTFYIRNGYWQNTTSTKNFFEKFFLEFSYIFTGAQHSIVKLMEGDCPYLIGHDIIAGIFSWIPSSLRPDGVINIWNYNTQLCTIGNKLYGQLPCDFITTSVYSVGLLGPLIYGIFYGCVIKLLDYWHLKYYNPVVDIFYCVIAMRIIRIVNYCLLYDFILGSFSIVLAALIWWCCKHIKIKA